MTVSVSTARRRPPVSDGPPLSRLQHFPSFKTEARVTNLHVAQHLPKKADRVNNQSANALLFGPFRLLPHQRLLLEGDKSVRLGSRALEILIALLERPGELVSKNELMARVWPNTFVEAANLTVHIAALRRALKDGQSGNRYLINIPGRGYRFVAPVRSETVEPSPSQSGAACISYNLPTSLTRLIGRCDVIKKLLEHLPNQRLVTIVGPGGIGKTSVALAVAESLTSKYDDGVCVVDLASLNDASLVPCAIADLLSNRNSTEYSLPDFENSLADLLTSLADKRMLLILDNCEHVIGATAQIAIDVLRRAPSVQILATSREPLRVEGEHVHRLSPLESPTPSISLTATEALAFPAVQLLVTRTAAHFGEFDLDDANAAIVAEICRKLDGIPLAIVFAAARVAAMGVRGVAAGLKDQLQLLTGGHRNTHPRQQTMCATLDWSYRLLTEVEQSILRRISIIDGSFTLRAATAIAADCGQSESEITDHILELVAKSLILADMCGVEPRLRLLETTRAYALRKLAESGEHDNIALHHMEHDRKLSGAGSRDNPVASRRSSHRADKIGKLRAVQV